MAAELSVREQMIEQIQLTARRLKVPCLHSGVFEDKSDGQLLAWVRRFAVLEFERTRERRYGVSHDRL